MAVMTAPRPAHRPWRSPPGNVAAPSRGDTSSCGRPSLGSGFRRRPSFSPGDCTGAPQALNAATTWKTKPVPGGEGGDVAAAGQRLQGDDVDGAAQLRPAATELPGRDAEELADPGPPLVSQGLSVHQDEGRDLVPGDDRAGHNGLPRPRGATSTPRSCWASSATASRWTGVSVAVQVKSWLVPGERWSMMFRRLPACPASEVTVPSMPRGRTRPPSMVSW